MSSGFVLAEIKGGHIVASQFGREWRIAASEVRRYGDSRGYPPAQSVLTRS
jgi:hypothetical protein